MTSDILSNMEKVYQLLKEASVWFIATDDGGQPRVRPFAPVSIFDGKLYFMTSRKKPVSKQMAANNRIEISAMLGSEKWIRITAEAIDDDSRTAKESFLAANPELAEEHPADDPNTQVLYLRNAVATIESFSAAREVIKF